MGRAEDAWTDYLEAELESADDERRGRALDFLESQGLIVYLDDETGYVSLETAFGVPLDWEYPDSR
jgi:hypothetical protein